MTFHTINESFAFNSPNFLLFDVNNCAKITHHDSFLEKTPKKLQKLRKMTAIGSSRLFVKNLPVKYTDEQVYSSFMTHQLNEHRERTCS